MGTVRKEAVIDAPVEEVWDALRDWGALHERLVPGFVVDAQLDGPDRIVTFFNDTTVKERFVDCDEDLHRLVWSTVSDSLVHHNASAQLFDEGAAGTRFVWIADFLPHEASATFDQMMERGTAVLRETMEAALRSG